MPPKLVSDDGRHIVIRPLAYCEESDLQRWAELQEFPIIPCDLCGSQENLQRQQIKRMLQEWDRQTPGRTATMFQALGNLAPSHLLDPRHHDFKTIRPDGLANPQGDRAFDPNC